MSSETELDYIPIDDETITRLRDTEAAKRESERIRLQNEFHNSLRGMELLKEDFLQYQREERMYIEERIGKKRTNGKAKISGMYGRTSPTTKIDELFTSVSHGLKKLKPLLM